MKSFIFLTQEGLTRTPKNIDVENLQVLGISQGINKEKAFESFIKENEYLKEMKFNEVIVMKLASEKQYHFLLKEYV